MDLATLWVVYDDRTQEIHEFRMENRQRHRAVLLTIVKPGGRPVEHVGPAGVQTAVDVFGIGKRRPGTDDGEYDLPPGLVVIFQHKRRARA